MKNSADMQKESSTASLRMQNDAYAALDNDPAWNYMPTGEISYNKKIGLKDAYFGEEPSDSFKIANLGTQVYKK
jgi:hypothetical protein